MNLTGTLGREKFSKEDYLDNMKSHFKRSFNEQQLSSVKNIEDSNLYAKYVI